MFEKAGKILKNKEKKQVFSNVVSLSFMQGANYIIPLVAIPYLVRVLGDDRFGLVMFAQAFIQYFVIFVDFGLELTATREISIHRENKERVRQIFSAVMYLKILLLLAAFLIMNAVVFTFPQFRNEWMLYYLTFAMVVGQMMFPVWYFQGIEKMKYVVIFNLIAKTTFTVLVFVTIFGPEDYMMYAVVNSAGYLIAGAGALIFAFIMLRSGFGSFVWQHIKEILHKTRDVFISNLGISLYMTSTPFLLGIVTGRNDLVGYYSVAEKAVRGLRYLITPVTQALFPYLSKKFASDNRADSVRLLRRLALYLTPVLLLIMAAVLIFAGPITFFLTGSYNPSTILNMRIMSVILLVGTYNNVFGVLGMVNLGMEGLFRNLVLLCGVFNLAVCIIASHFLLDLGASISIVLTESLLFVLLYVKLRKSLKS
jgi:polysaccharide transporter, PST family